MYELVLRPLARKDLKGIWRYSFEQWGEAQASRYLHKLDDALVRLKANPGLGKSYDNIHPGLRGYRVSRHTVFYTVEAAEIVIVRVLHERMDTVRHLPE